MNPFLKWSTMAALVLANGVMSPVNAQFSPLKMPSVDVPSVDVPSVDVPSAKDALSESGLDDITDQATQLMTWACKRENNLIAVEAKEIDNWQSLINKDSAWTCGQNISTIPDGSPSFSCESSANMGLLTVFWLTGEDGKTQMKTWMNDLANDQNLVCTRSQSNPFWE